MNPTKKNKNIDCMLWQSNEEICGPSSEDSQYHASTYLTAYLPICVDFLLTSHITEIDVTFPGCAE